MKRNNAVTTIMFTVVALLLVVIFALGVVTVIKSKRLKQSEAETSPTPTAAVAANTETPTPVPTDTPAPTLTPTPKAVICLDPGHQKSLDNNTEPAGPGSDEKVARMASSGASGLDGRIQEYEWNLCVAKLIQAELEKRGYTAILTRTENDANVSNMERAQCANENNADILVGIQVDAYNDQSVKGIFAQTPSKDNPYVGNLASESEKLARSIMSAVSKTTGAKERSIQNGNNKLALINWAKMPVCIMQLGYLSNPEEAELLATPEYQEKLVQSVCDGIEAYFAGKN